MAGPHARLRRLSAVTAATTLALAGLAAVAPAAEAAPVPRTFTTSITPIKAVPGVPTAYGITVKNTSTVISALDHVVLLVPAGFTVTPGSVSAPRGGWAESLNATGTELTAKTTKPLQYALRKGESLNLAFTAIDTTNCDNTVATWKSKADGILVDPFTAQGPAPTVQMAPVADRFVVTSTTDVSPIPGNQVVVGQGFDVAGQFRCGASLVAPAGSAGSVSLSKVGATPAGSLGGTLSAGVSATDTTATVSGATYDTIVSSVTLKADWSGGADDTAAVEVLGAATTVNGVPNQATSLTLPDAVANLGAGANGPVALVVQACNPAEVTCSDGTEISLAGSFKDGAGQPLYSFAAPVSLTRACPASACPHQVPGQPGQEDEGSSSYSYNYFCPGNSCDTDFDEREVEEDFAWYPTYVSLRNADGSYQPFKQATRCVDLPTSWNDPAKATKLSLTGTIQATQAKADKFCVDVNGITRANDRFDGELRIPILFVEDPRIRP